MWYAIIFTYYFFLAILLYCKYRKRKTWILLSKILTSLAFVAVGLLALRENPDAWKYAIWILTGLGLSVGGDIFLVYGERTGAFVGGWCCFLLVHITYGTVFAIYSGPMIWDALFFIILAGIGIAVQRYHKIDLQKMVVPALVYLLAISFMTAQAISLCTANGPGTLAVVAGLGALLFYISDGLLAWDRFKQPSLRAGVLSLLCYYTAQLLLALSIRF